MNSYPTVFESFVFRLKLVGLSFVLVFSTHVNAEKYFTWVDEMGRVNHTVIPEEDNPLIKPGHKDNLEKKTDVSDVSAVGEFEQAPNPSKPTAPIVSERNSPSIPTETNATNDIPHSLKLDASETSVQPTEQKEAVRKIEINEADYIDGDVLLEQGSVRDDSDLPYYTWTDAEGIIRNTPYRPGSSSDAVKQSKGGEKAEKIEPEYTVYDEYLKVDSSVIGGSQLKQSEMDDFAQTLFFSDNTENFIDTFSKQCCTDLVKESPESLSFEDSVYIELDKNASTHYFSEGKSPYKLVELPHLQERYSLKLKTFIKTSSKTGVKNGVFFPQLVFLNDEFEVLRIVRNPVLEYVPENWRRHGYLKGLFEMDGGDNSRYILINTTKENLRARNQVENKNTVILNNQKLGAIELEALRK
ncbi:MalM family protein [Alkalimarinus alittae]|uniref:MalM family protein n=1 Tax=Alkalimarinus alittae TaxID=2961619 RepID=A0ABY6MXU3_9ALTE|nr:MalM family protein [Alkalimarinus alittae]UZE94662.1 MalM family protein [Alkalimarinus alittae]